MPEEVKNIPTQIIEKMRAKNVNVERLSQLSGVSERYISLLIEGKTDNLPPEPYVRGYIKKISEILELDEDDAWKEFLDRTGNIRKSGDADKLPSNRFEKKSYGGKILLLVFLLIPIAVFVLARSSYTRKPEIDLNNLKAEITTTNTRLFTIIGVIDPAYTLRINDEQVLVEEDGSFGRETILDPGLNTITFRAKRLLGKEHIIIKRILYEKPRAPVIQPVFIPIETQSTTTVEELNNEL